MVDVPLQTKILVNGNKFSCLINSNVTLFRAILGENYQMLVTALRTDIFNLLYYFDKTESNYFECLCVAHYAELIDNVYFGLRRDKIAKVLSNIRRLSIDDIANHTKDILRESDLPIRNESYFHISKFEISSREKELIEANLADVFLFVIDSLITADGNISALEQKSKEEYLVLMANSLSGAVDSLDIVRERYAKQVFSFDLIDSLEYVLKSNSSELQANNPDSMRDGLRIISYLRKKQELILKSRSIFDNCVSNNQLPGLIEMINEQIKNYNFIFYYSLLYFDTIKNNRHYEYYSIREFFESSGIFQSHFEDILQENLDGIRQDLNSIGKNIVFHLVQVNQQLLKINEGISQINSNLREVVDSIQSLERTTFQALQAVGAKISSEVKKLNLSVSENLRSINSGIALNNLFSAVQIYQNHKIRKSLDKK